MDLENNASPAVTKLQEADKALQAIKTLRETEQTYAKKRLSAAKAEIRYTFRVLRVCQRFEAEMISLQRDSKRFRDTPDGCERERLALLARLRKEFPKLDFPRIKLDGLLTCARNNAQLGVLAWPGLELPDITRSALDLAMSGLPGVDLTFNTGEGASDAPIRTHSRWYKFNDLSELSPGSGQTSQAPTGTNWTSLGIFEDRQLEQHHQWVQSWSSLLSSERRVVHDDLMGSSAASICLSGADQDKGQRSYLRQRAC